MRAGETVANLSRQTGGARLVVSNGAVFDADLQLPVLRGSLLRRRVFIYQRTRLGGIDRL
jgi:hypothetical protein